MSARRMPADERRAHIVVAARRLFASRGYDATTTRQIATEAGVRDALIYRHFADKQAILHAIVDAGIARVAEMRPAAPESNALAATLHGLGEAFLAALDEQRDLIRLMVSQRHLLADDKRFVVFV